MNSKSTHYRASLMHLGKINYKTIYENSLQNAYYYKYKIENYEYPTIEYDIQTALKSLLKVFWLDPKNKSEISGLMHHLGKKLNRDFGCKLNFEDGFYSTDCPNLLLHNNFGFSLRGSEKHKCSICNRDVIDCIHREGNKYDKVECQSFNEVCNICNESINSCDHQIGSIYNQVEACTVVYDLEIITFDVVKNPKFPLARIEKIYFSERDIKKFIRLDKNFKDFKSGSSIIECHHCLQCNPEENQFNLFE